MSETESTACQVARFVGEALDALGYKSPAVKLLVYGYCTGKLSSRKIARAVTRSAPYQILAGTERPQAEELIELRRGQRALLQNAFRRLLALSAKLGMPSLGRVQLGEAPERQVAVLLERAEQLDRLEEQLASLLSAEPGLPGELADPARRGQLLAKAASSLASPPVVGVPAVELARAHVEPSSPAEQPRIELGGQAEDAPSEDAFSPPPSSGERESRSVRRTSRRKGSPMRGVSLSGLQRAMQKNVSAFVLLGFFLLVLGGFSVINALPDNPKPRKGTPVTPPRPANMPMLYVGSGLLTGGMLVFVALVAFDPAAPKRRRRRQKTRL